MVSKNKFHTVNDLINILEKGKLIMFLDIQGICAEDIRRLRNIVFENNLKMKVFKNTLQKIAFCKSSFKERNINLKGQTAVLWDTGDSLCAAKILSDFKKAGVRVKSGLHEKVIVDSNYITYLSQIPDIKVLKSNLLLLVSLVIKKILFILHYYPETIIKILQIRSNQTNNGVIKNG